MPCEAMGRGGWRDATMSGASWDFIYSLLNKRLKTRQTKGINRLKRLGVLNYLIKGMVVRQERGRERCLYHQKYIMKNRICISMRQMWRIDSLKAILYCMLGKGGNSLYFKSTYTFRVGVLLVGYKRREPSKSGCPVLNAWWFDKRERKKGVYTI